MVRSELLKKMCDLHPNILRKDAKKILDKAGHLGSVNTILYLDMMHLLPGNNLVKPDRMAMSVSLETRAPFLDYRMMEFAFSIASDVKTKGQTSKYILKKAVRNLIGNNQRISRKKLTYLKVG